jgi:hypothetical protein
MQNSSEYFLDAKTNKFFKTIIQILFECLGRSMDEKDFERFEIHGLARRDTEKKNFRSI